VAARLAPPASARRVFPSFSVGNFVGLTRGLLDPAIEIASLGRIFVVTLVLVALWTPVLILGGASIFVLARAFDSILGPATTLVLSIGSLALAAVAIGASVAVEATRATAPAGGSPRRLVPDRVAKGVILLAGAAVVLGIARLVMILYA
jgi:hypothetical protein